MSGFDLSVSVSLVTVFVQGILSFFSPCVLPLLPLYLGYLSGSMGDTQGAQTSRAKTLVNTLFFVIGISAAFFLLALGMTALGQALHQYQKIIIQVGGILIIAFGLFQLEVFRPMALEQDRRIRFPLQKLAMSPLVALVFGFTFSFAWTPCVGPALASVLLMAGSADTAVQGFALIGLYTLGFVLPFLAVALFAGVLLQLFQKHRNVVRYTVKVGGALLVIIGLLMVTGWMDALSGSLASSDPQATPTAQVTQQPEATDTPEATDAPQESQAPIPALDFTLTDQFGNTHTLDQYKGQTILLNFWATWCGPCRSEMPDLQAIYEDYGKNEKDLVVLGITAPNLGDEGSVEDITAFLEENGYTYPTLMNEDASLFYAYGISSFPTTFMIDKNGNVYGYVPGALSRESFDNIIQQTMDGANS
ncbi:cytochrome c biogenesis protein CcdA [Pseudoflavonifractor sp. An85]|uniref:redoxin domain-containing protein n=1 Tax=Pseudoflavonifractor sp. An85 TaxID=1965661 RepID=UPI000B38FA17|nr:cytochrome c biogenesis protein CcdA [Pseudoflavonifractor sp. An85]OUN22429.1 cytochrome C biogenesis protein [Pseudoflavonifractor sp. An85]